MGYGFYLHVATASTYKGAAGPYSDYFLLSYRSVFTYACREQICGARRLQTFIFLSLALRVVTLDMQNHFSVGCYMQSWHICLLFQLHSNLKFWNGWSFQCQLQIKQLFPPHAPIT